MVESVIPIPDKGILILVVDGPSYTKTANMDYRALGFELSNNSKLPAYLIALLLALR